MSITSRIDSTNKLDDRWKDTVLPAPKSVKISLDDSCQFKCGFCANSKMAQRTAMSWGQFTALIDELAAEGVEEVGLFYIGEPMLVKHLPAAVKYCKDAGIDYVFLTTNGALATPEKLKPLMEAGLDSLKFSFNYSDGEMMHSVAKVPTRTFGTLVRNIMAARKLRDEGNYKCGIYASSIMFEGWQQAQMQTAVEQIKDYVDEHYWLPQYSFGAQATMQTATRGNPGRLDNLRDPLPCWAIFREGHVTAAGEVSLCCFDVGDAWSAGNLKDGTFMEAWNSEKAQALRKAHLAGDVHGTACEACVYGA